MFNCKHILLIINLIYLRYMKNFVDREYEEVEGGYLGDDGFYYTPNGSKIFITELNYRLLGHRLCLF